MRINPLIDWLFHSEKAQRRGRPPTKFPKKPRGANFQVSEVDSSGEAP